MASRFSALEGHAQQDQVDKWIYQRKTVRWISKQLVPPVSPMSVQRYRTNLLGPALKRLAAKLSNTANLPVQTIEGGQIVDRSLHAVTQEALADERANPLIERSELLWGEAWSAVLDAKRAVSTFTDSEGVEHIRGRDFSVVAPIINAAARSLELFGRGAGYLTDQVGAPQQNTIVLVLPAQAGADAGPAAMTLDVTAEK